MGLGTVQAAMPSAPRTARSTTTELLPEAFLEQLKERANIVDVVARRVNLKKSGAGFVGLCPFHSEKSPSFTVSAARNTFHCFGCGAHGNAIGFLIEHDGIPFRQAVRELAQEVGMALPEPMRKGADAVFDVTPLYEAMSLAQRFFGHCLKHTPPALQYLRQRGVQGAMLKRFAIGYAPAEWRGLREAFADYATNPVILQAGLVREKTPAEPAASGATAQGTDLEARRGTRYDTFRDRITFGVRDMRGRIVAFGGRALPAQAQHTSGHPSEHLSEHTPEAQERQQPNQPQSRQGQGAPKYLNSPESPIFDKSGSLFGLFEAREAIRLNKHAVVVEGYLDVITMAQHGIENVVAAMGTAFTRWHLERLLTQTSRVVFCFDGDRAGRAAASKAMSVCASLLADGHDFRFVIFPEGMDPDEFVGKHGAQAARELIAAAPGWAEFMLTTLMAEHGVEPGKADASNAQARAQFAAQAIEVASRIPRNTSLRAIVLEQIAKESKVPGSAVQALRQAQRQARPPERDLWDVLASSVRVAGATALSVRQELLGLLDEQSVKESALAQVLRALDPAAAKDDTSSPRHLMARDTLRGAVELIFDFRLRQVREELDRRLNAEVIGSEEYLRARSELDAMRVPRLL